MSVQDMNIVIEDVSAVCRGCLKPSLEMKNMIEYDLDEDFYKLTNIKVNSDDVLSKLLCSECEEVITGCRGFRRLCTQSDYILNIALKNQLNEQTFEEKLSQNTVTYVLSDKKLTIKVLAPDTEEKITYRCTQKCPERFKKKNDLLQHIIKQHNVDNNFIVDVKYYCSVPDCHYNINSVARKHFVGRKYLNQHVGKVHKDKITCTNCLVNFPNSAKYEHHLEKCSLVYICEVCCKKFKTNDRLLVHYLRKHPELHKKFKMERRMGKRKIHPEFDEKGKTEEGVLDYVDSPKRSFATQTSELRHIKNDVSLASWQEKADYTKKDENSTQTVFDLLSLKSQMSEDDSIFYSETVSLSDIQTQTVPIEFGLSRSNKETITSETQSPDLSIKETQTCFCLYDSFKPNSKCGYLGSGSLCTTETQTLSFESDLLSVSSAETQTHFENDSSKDF